MHTIAKRFAFSASHIIVLLGRGLRWGERQGRLGQMLDLAGHQTMGGKVQHSILR